MYSIPVGISRGRGTHTGKKTPGKRHRGEPGHTRETRDTRAHARAHGSHGRTSQPSTQTQRHTRTTTRRPKPRPTQQPQEQPQARSRPLPAADSEEAAPSEPDPASTRSQSASPRLLEGGARRNEGARGRCVYTAGGAVGGQTEPPLAPDELKTREAETHGHAQRPRRSRPESAASRS